MMITKRRIVLTLAVIFALTAYTNVYSYSLSKKDTVIIDTNSLYDTNNDSDLNVLETPLSVGKKDSSAFKPRLKYNYSFLYSEKPDSIESLVVEEKRFNEALDSLTALPTSRLDQLLFSSNPLTLPLIFIGGDYKKVWNEKINLKNIPFVLKEYKKYNLIEVSNDNIGTEQIVKQLRDDVRIRLANKNLSLYAYNISDLSNTDIYKSKPLQHAKINTIEMDKREIDIASQSISVDKAKPMYWIKKANALLQFSQNYQTPNWYKGGHNIVAFLSSFNAELNYDNLKNKNNVIWENKLEWRAGFNSVEGDTLRKVAVNEDILRYITKFGIKAGGRWYYSLSGEVNTLLFDNFKGINSNDYKARLFTPVRANLGLGMNYKHDKAFSLMIAPLTFKYLYVNDTVNVNPNSFGIKKGQNELKQFGSSLNAQLKYSPAKNWDINSRLTFYTNYEKVEIDWEITNNFIINRFLTARLLLNPRYDNTVILKKGERARIQFKEYMSLGFSFRLI